jgi:hypothetical protein
MPKSVEIILRPELLSVVVVEPFGPGFAPLLDKLGQDTALQLVECSSSMETLSVVRQLSSCLVLIHIRSNSDLAPHLTLLKTLIPQIYKKAVRVLATAGAGLTADIAEKLTVAGCTEIVPDTTAPKALLFKVERHLKALPPPSGGLTSAPAPVRAGVSPSAMARAKLAEEVESAPPTEISAGVRLSPELGLSQDMWCFSGGGARRASGKWRIRLRGPAPEEGRWLALDKGQWQWKPAGEAGVEPLASGWTFAGEFKPEYSAGTWTFGGAHLSLGYFENQNPLGYKFNLNSKGSLVVSRDSDVARAALDTGRGKAVQKTAKTEDISTIALVDPPKSAGAAQSEGRVVYVEPLTLASDFWLVEKNAPKRVAERWLIRLVGPGAAVGRWLPQEDNKDQPSESRDTSSPHWSGSVEKWWRWVPDAGDRDPFLKEEGAWFFYGLSPNFLDGVWSFASSSPELGFYLDGECYGAKCRLRDDGVLEMARDSKAARQALPLVLQSFERRVAPKAAPVRPQGQAGEVEDRGAEDLVVSPEPEQAGAEDLRLVEPDPTAGLEKIFAVEPPGPTLSPLALAFLASELISQRDKDLRTRCDRYCAYLMASFGGLRAEIWLRAGNEVPVWICIGTPDHGPGQFEPALRQGSGLRAQGEQPVYVASIRPVLRDPIGMLVLGGKGAQKVEAAYAEAAARMVVGMVLGVKYQREGAA